LVNAPSHYYGGGESVPLMINTSVNENYVVHIYGNGINSKLEVNDDDDLVIVEATLNKLRKKLKEKNQGGIVLSQNSET
jgi:phage repressor protein C with HTH and peptisase S24 domain